MKIFFGKIIGATLATAVIGSSMMMSVNAATVYNDDFEFGISGAIEAGVPTLKVYGENLVSNTGFETGDKGNFVGVGLTSSIQFQVKDYAKRSGNYGVDFTGGQSTSWGYGIRYQLADSRDKITKGLYEINAWVKSRDKESLGSQVSLACCTRALAADADNNVEATNVADDYWKLNRSYCISPPIELTESWQKVTGYMVFTDTPDVNAENLSLFFSFNKKNAASVGFFFDDVSMRKIENVDIMDNADMPNAFSDLQSQKNVPYGTLASCAGKTGTVFYPISNNTQSDINLTFVAALYDGTTDALNSILDVREVTVKPGQSHPSASFNIPDYVTNTYVIKYYIWDELNEMFPFTESFINSNVAYKIGAYFDIPNTKGWNSTSNHPTYASWKNAYPEYLDMLSATGSSGNGMNSLYLPFAKTITNSTIVFKDIPNLEANTTYTLSFDICSVSQCADPCTFAVTKGSTNAITGTSADAENMLQLSALDNSGFTTYDNQGLDGGVWTRIYKAPVGWNKISYTFTTTDEGTYSIAFRKAYNGYKTQANSNVFGGCYIDNVTITK